jgi:hypothetical protein
VVGSIPDEFIGFFNSFHPHYGPTFDSASKRKAPEIFLWGKGRPAHKADNLTAIYQLII